MRYLFVILVMLASPASAEWLIDTQHSRASGQKRCAMSQSPLMIVIVPSRAGPVGVIGPTEETYPGRKVHIGRDGQSFSGIDMITLTPDLVANLKRWRSVYMSWSPWPSGGRREVQASLNGFAEAYDRCERFVTK